MKTARACHANTAPETRTTSCRGGCGFLPLFFFGLSLSSFPSRLIFSGASFGLLLTKN